MFKKPANWNFLELDDDVIDAHSVLGPVIGFWLKKCKHFMKNDLTNYSDTLTKLET